MRSKMGWIRTQALVIRETVTFKGSLRPPLSPNPGSCPGLFRALHHLGGVSPKVYLLPWHHMARWSRASQTLTCIQIAQVGCLRSSKWWWMVHGPHTLSTFSSPILCSPSVPEPAPFSRPSYLSQDEPSGKMSVFYTSIYETPAVLSPGEEVKKVNTAPALMAHTLSGKTSRYSNHKCNECCTGTCSRDR